MINSSKCSLCSTVSEHISCILIIFSSWWPEVKRSAKLLIASNFGPYWISVLFNPWNQVWYYNAHMFSKEYIIGKFLVRFGVHRTYAESGVQSQSWPSFSTDRQHFTRSRMIASFGSPTKNKDISINASFDNHWCHIVTHPTTKFAWNMTRVSASSCPLFSSWICRSFALPSSAVSS